MPMFKVADDPQSVSEFLERAKAVRRHFKFMPTDRFGPWFRGHQRAEWRLLPKLYREYGGFAKVRGNEIEDEIREEFIVRAPILCEHLPAEDARRAEWEWYFMMQHFGTPTRLLDWTEGALIALYFAVKDNPGYYDAAVWALDPYGLNKRVIGQKYVIPPSATGVTSREQERVKPWLPERFTKMRGLPTQPIAVYPTHTARRISTQRSCFTVHGTQEDALDQLSGGRNACLIKIPIPGRIVQRMRRELEAAGIDEATIFPDLSGLSRAIAARWQSDHHKYPHTGVFGRLRPSKVHRGGIGVFAIRKIKKGTALFENDNQELVWFREGSLPKAPTEIRKLYDDFAIIKDHHYACPPSFNRLTIAWYLNEPKRGGRPNVRANPVTNEFFALRNIKPGEELTVQYLDYSDLP